MTPYISWVCSPGRWVHLSVMEMSKASPSGKNKIQSGVPLRSPLMHYTLMCFRRRNSLTLLSLFHISLAHPLLMLWVRWLLLCYAVSNGMTLKQGVNEITSYRAGVSKSCIRSRWSWSPKFVTILPAQVWDKSAWTFSVKELPKAPTESLRLLLSPSERRHLPAKCAISGILWWYVAQARERQHLRTKANCCRRHSDWRGRVMSLPAADVALGTCLWVPM